MDNKRMTNEAELEELKKDLKEKIAISVWLQTIGQISEAALLSKLYLLNGGQAEGEKRVVAGFVDTGDRSDIRSPWGHKGIATANPELILQGQQEAVLGEFLQGVGGLTTAAGGAEVLYEEGMGRTGFVP